MPETKKERVVSSDGSVQGQSTDAFNGVYGLSGQIVDGQILPPRRFGSKVNFEPSIIPISNADGYSLPANIAVVKDQEPIDFVRAVAAKRKVQLRKAA